MTQIFSEFLKQHLCVVIQPIVDAVTKEVHFYEILSRVEFGGKTHFPADFIPDMNIQMRLRLAKHLFKSICELQAKYPDMTFSLNISSIEIDLGIDEFLESLFLSPEYHLDTNRCVIEITEHASIDNPKTFESIKNIKKRFGFKFALDDFGSKFSTLNKIYDAEDVFDYIKIDGALIKDIESDYSKQVSLHHIVQLIQANGKKAIVEYISSEEVHEKVMIANPDYLQGFLFGKPCKVEDYLNIKS